MRAYIFILSLVISTNVFGQANEFVNWTTAYDAETSSIILTASMKDKWVIYSQHTDPDGPIPLSFDFENTDGLTLEGDVVEETTPIEVVSEMFGVTVRKFKDKAVFRQKVKGTPAGSTLAGNVTFMTCDDTKCLPPETVDFVVKF